ncbi:hypothetical protein FA95DRAFT_240861 [Auriscalpium vulgare]|uniref:Uncharacterized protein n=1 Tax=Auriscalpium vulgare TaxID=40419 RepID=A0ACB8S6P0_9AGAM|nr:hypothetical protein FA95DRAFT_240861 [Auriscalpium vulgare]
MLSTIFFFAAALLGYLPLAAGHASIWHPSMWGFNVTQQTFSYDNRPVAPLTNFTFQQWWFHGHLDFPPHPEDVFELPAGQNVTTQIGCNKGATDFFASSEGGDIRSGNDPCPGSPTAEYHTSGIDDVKGCALAIAYKSDVNDVKPEDFTVFSVNQTCVFYRFTDFAVPARMPPCPDGKCICAWFWIHSPDSGGEQNYMNGFQCNVVNSTSNVALATPQVPRRCGVDSQFKQEKSTPVPGNCTYGAKNPFYWFQAEQNNMLEGTFAPPFYTDLYNFLDGPQDDIFVDSYASIPSPNANQTQLPALKNLKALKLPNASLLPASVVSSAEAPQATSESSATTSSSLATAIPSSAPSSSSSSVGSSSPLPASSSSVPASSSSLPASSSPSALTSSAATPLPTETVFRFVTVVVASPSASSAAPAASPSILALNPSDSDVPANTTQSLVAANVGQLLDVTDDGNANNATTDSAPAQKCRSKVKALDATGPDGSTVKRSFMERLGVGTYERKREMHRRGLGGLWW